ncbi:MAG: phosphomethylpyrimidine synthase ThiC [Deltaproteobacteria bacterium]|nr:phosphomethylpyrimidine synthase ThiC [Deltaproteobacteria bacterium]
MNETRIHQARKGILTDEMQAVARQENLSPEFIAEGLAKGHIVITRNNKRTDIAPLGIGKGLSIKINANIGTSRDLLDIEGELEKARVAVEAGAHTVMDLSTGGDLPAIRKDVMKAAPVPLGTVPFYEAAARALDKHSSFCLLTEDELFDVIEDHLASGVDFLTVHCGVTLGTLGRMEKEGRIMDMVSRGGALTAAWMRYNEKDNPLFTSFDRLVELSARYDATLSLGDGFRPGATGDATDRAQLHELITLGELQQHALEQGVQVMVEGPGHVPLDQVQANVLLQKRLCHEAPFYVLGPLVTDLAPGYDHITGAIGGAVAAWAGADFLCYVTPAEHLRLPDVDDVRQGVMASRIAAVAGELARGMPGTREREHKMSKARRMQDWDAQYELAIDPTVARGRRGEAPPADESVCSMCGEFCAIKVQNDAKEAKAAKTAKT